MGLGYELLGFESGKDYFTALKGVPRNGPSRVFRKQTVGEPGAWSMCFTIHT